VWHAALPSATGPLHRPATSSGAGPLTSIAARHGVIVDCFRSVLVQPG